MQLFIQLRAATQLLLAISLLAGFTACSPQENKPVSQEEAMEYLNTTGLQYATDINEAVQAGDTVTAKNIFGDVVCGCYSKVDMNRLYDKRMALFQTYIDNESIVLAEERRFAEQYGGEQELAKGCQILEMVGRLALYKVVLKKEVDKLLDPGCLANDGDVKSYESMVDSMQTVVSTYEIEYDEKSIQAIEDATDEAFQEMEEKGTMTEEVRRKRQLYEAMKKNRNR